ncbi:MAG: hypothetical protein H6Q16_1087 [Bacteroidetes bacterium]|nr:hypothetical protein [Bacteroidota bacterium]
MYALLYSVKTNIYIVFLIIFSLLSIKSLSQNCLNFRDITNTSFVTCYYGTYVNPYLNTGIVSNRHSIITNSSLKDANTNYHLSMVPPGETYSIKLGNDFSNYQAEAIKYTFRVDTNNFDILIMKYAVVLENPDHNLFNQPRFKMEILDSSNVLIDSCGYADFYASSSLGWNFFNDVVWKNWTTIGIDLSNYHNKIINLRFTTYDCNLGAHYGYAYYNLSCEKKNIKQMSCGDDNNLVFEAPKGFNYHWYSSSDTTVFSTSQTITIPSSNLYYFCRCSSLEDADCNFTLSVLAQRQYPYADFQFIVDNCQKKIQLIDNSIISSSNDSAVGNTPCDSIIWILPGNSPYYDINPTFFFDTAGTYPISIIAFIDNGLCIDTFKVDIIIPDNMINNISFSPFDNNICQGDSLSISINDVFDNYYWSNGDTTNSIIVSPTDTSKFFIRAFDSYGCEKIDSVTIYVNPIQTTNINDSICQGQTYNLYGFNEGSAGIHKKTLINIYGCDSIIYLNLKVNPVFRDTIYAEICKGGTFNQYGFVEDSTGIYARQFQSILGCDSIIYLNLNVNPYYNDTIYAEICLGKTYNMYGFNESHEGLYYQHLQTEEGCDSSVTLNLYVQEMGQFQSIFEENELVVDDLPITLDASCDYCNNYNWNSGSKDSLYTVYQYGLYIVSYENACGQFLDSIFLISPEVSVFVPNAFTPLEYTNNIFFPVYVDDGKVEIESFEIYNRWGEKIFSNTVRGWDGTFKGKLVSSGVFVWRLLYKTNILAIKFMKRKEK